MATTGSLGGPITPSCCPHRDATRGLWPHTVRAAGPPCLRTRRRGCGPHPTLDFSGNQEQLGGGVLQKEQVHVSWSPRPDGERGRTPDTREPPSTESLVLAAEPGGHRGHSQVARWAEGCADLPAVPSTTVGIGFTVSSQKKVKSL